MPFSETAWSGSCPDDAARIENMPSARHVLSTWTAPRLDRARQEVDVHRTVAGALALCSVASVLGCVHEYHPEYHPETSYSYVQNVVTVVAPPPAVYAPSIVFLSAPAPVSPTRVFPTAVARKSFREARAASPIERHESPAPEPRAAQLAPMFASDISRASD
jgi:hypothetical protein